MTCRPCTLEVGITPACTCQNCLDEQERREEYLRAEVDIKTLGVFIPSNVLSVTYSIVCRRAGILARMVEAHCDTRREALYDQLSDLRANCPHTHTVPVRAFVRCLACDSLVLPKETP